MSEFKERLGPTRHAEEGPRAAETLRFSLPATVYVSAPRPDSPAGQRPELTRLGISPGKRGLGDCGKG